MESPVSRNKQHSTNSIIIQALEEAQQAKDNSETGVYFIEYKKKLEPLLHENGFMD